MGMILRIASSRIVGQGDIVGRSGYFSLNLSANSVMRGRLDARRTLKSLVADLRDTSPVRFLKRDDRRHPFSQSAGGEPCRFQMYRFSMVLQGESASDKGSCAI